VQPVCSTLSIDKRTLGGGWVVGGGGGGGGEKDYKYNKGKEWRHIARPYSGKGKVGENIEGGEID